MQIRLSQNVKERLFVCPFGSLSAWTEPTIHASANEFSRYHPSGQGLQLVELFLELIAFSLNYARYIQGIRFRKKDIVFAKLCCWE